MHPDGIAHVKAADWCTASTQLPYFDAIAPYRPAAASTCSDARLAANAPAAASCHVSTSGSAYATCLGRCHSHIL